MSSIESIWLAADPCPAVTDPGWLTQPKATVVAAVIAVVGALIAYAGVTKTTRTTRRENRREEKVAVLTEASAAIQELTRAIDRIALTTDPAARAQQVAKMDDGPMKKLGDRYSLSETKLELYGFTDSAKAAKSLSDTLMTVWNGLRRNSNDDVDLAQSHDEYDEALKAIQTALKELP
ncbi:hypothetical protein GAN17_20105 [Mycobacterium kubicae]|uniref:hypothetical protein n=1 Tax=Mycobacterium kubicae TaxID=120959 RepID=UPI001640D05E|nr:hypothetical protein [Mycobacterium kubicae]QNI08310.1 hypothetical protein GAN17_20105 [Mycobacterium kubicae]